MDASYEPKMKSWGLSLSYLDANKNVSGVPRFDSLISEVKSDYQRAESLMVNLLYDPTGVTKEKNNLKAEVLSRTGEFCSMMAIYARDQNLPKLEAEAKKTKREIVRATQMMISDRAKGMLARAEEHKENLAEYGITREMISIYNELITRFDESIMAPRMTITERKNAKNELKTIFSRMTRKFKDLDLIVRRFRKTDQQFCAGYFMLRKMVATRGVTIAFRGVVIDVATGERVSEAKVELKHKENEATRILKHSASRGGFIIRSMTPGTYIITTTKTGYVPNTIEIVVEENTTTEVKIEMEEAV